MGTVLVTAFCISIVSVWTSSGSTVRPEDKKRPLSKETNLNQQNESVSDHNKTYCYFNVCTCTGPLVNCGFGGLSYIPRFWVNITQVNLTDNEIHVVDVQTLYNLTFLKLEFLSLARNNISHITADAFTTLRDIKHLDLSGNALLTPDKLALGFNGLGKSFIESLTLNKMRLKQIPLNMFNGMRKTHLKYLMIEDNLLEEFSQEAFSPLSNIRVIEADGNKIETLQWGRAQHLSKISLRHNNVMKLPFFCGPASAVYYPNLKKLNLDHNLIINIGPPVLSCLPRLQTLALSSNPIGKLNTNTFAMLPNLKTLFLQNLRGGATPIESYAFNNSYLKRITLKGSQIIFKQYAHIDSFRGCTKLDSLDISFNNLHGLNDSFLEEFFQDIHNITGLAIGSCKLDKVPRAIMTSFQKLKYLQLYNNRINNLPSDMFKFFKHLSYLFVNENKITTFDRNMFSSSVRKQLETVSFANNPFACTCDVRWFVDWANHSRNTVFKQYPYFYKCYTPSQYRNRAITTISFSEQFCMFNTTVYILIVGTCIPVLILITICSLVYRWRWHLRYFVYRLRRRDQHREQAVRQFTYDGFVVYSSEETNWVRQNLIPHLEDTAGLRLCVHERDFDVGGAIVDNIVENIEASRKVLIIVSLHTLQSEWCQFEINFAHRRSLNAAPGSLVIVLKEDIDNRHMSNNIRALLELHTYIMWPADDNDIEARNLFWERLEAEIRREV